MEINAQIHLKEREIEAMRNELASLVMPAGGDISLFAQYGLMSSSCNQQIDLYTEQLYYLRRTEQEIKVALKAAFLEYEKFLYLHTQEEKLVIDKHKKMEALYLDEVAIMGYNLQGNK